MVLKENTSSETPLHYSARNSKRKRRQSRGNDNRSKSKVKIVIICCGSILLLSLVIFLCFAIPRITMSPEDTVIKFSEEFNDGRYKKMLSYVEPAEAKVIRSVIDKLPSGISENALETILPFVSDITNTKLYPEIINTKEEKKRSVVTVQFKTLDDENYYDVYLSKKNGVWYIKYFWLSSEINE